MLEKHKKRSGNSQLYESFVPIHHVHVAYLKHILLYQIKRLKVWGKPNEKWTNTKHKGSSTNKWWILLSFQCSNHLRQPRALLRFKKHVIDFTVVALCSMLVAYFEALRSRGHHRDLLCQREMNPTRKLENSSMQAPGELTYCDLAWPAPLVAASLRVVLQWSFGFKELTTASQIPEKQRIKELPYKG